MNIISELEQRGLIYQSSGLEALKERLKEGQITLYCGFDPTADSLHIGSLIPILCLKRFQEAGHKPVVVVGGATALLGDPSGKEKERDVNPDELVAGWAEMIKNQLSGYLDFGNSVNSAIMVNNYEWISKISAFEYLRDIGKKFSINVMVSRESVKRRLSDPEKGISYTEFSYMIMQAFDYLKLNEKYNCELQVGGSDQWGNITAGMDLIWKKLNKKVHSLTFPLIETADGHKIGKTEKGTIWLDGKKTSPYELYQYWLNIDDKDVVKFLKFYTFLSLEEISTLEKGVLENPEKREAQKVLASEVTAIIHGVKERDNAIMASKAFFGEAELNELPETTFESICLTTPHIKAVKSDEMPKILDLLVEGEFFTSKSNARKDVQGGGIYLNNKRITDVNYALSDEDLIHGKYFVLRKGKKNFKPGVF